ncbi:tRNA (adenosine(37)-N6)-threonylcarbamoyltransferase complex ATPase subunit type 1 TsaE [Thermochromatium tepidum]|uniref:tRNA threonylcarbamoyladenosine biosynthesis protein TsaE n=1 Tax=Thermochromatium tepidum ATCC 43061 TaxID=316276 RepID=A0A6I6E5W5_THETI|nr:tRNA (adenosine(37)-N6)-threonylcarbamoyltransferase complex ATPase subunit type 1 TsaE [Thermochromatium tepidum]QGU33222.1 tRNA (adenosine(37)-N6)-threonylcarbamoyltransferase complex ATPase subunit type 1 TsaE [Thermochromatium tepidum ATCC 43061]
MPATLELTLDTPESQMDFGAHLARALKPPCVIFLEGDLGTGKTTLTRGILRGLGHSGVVRSPTYTLVEPYALNDLELYHFDLYRLGDPEELDYLGPRDLLGKAAVWVIEWPERGAGFLPKPDLRIQLVHLDVGRRLTLNALSPSGQTLLADVISVSDVSAQHLRADT